MNLDYIPYSEEAEKAVLGSILMDPSVLEKISEILKPRDFYRQAHQKLFQVIIDMQEENEPVDIVTLTKKLIDRKILDEVGGVPYLDELSKSVPTTENIRYYAKIVEEKSGLRDIIKRANQAILQAQRGEENVEKIAIDLQDGIQQIQDRAASTTKERVFSIGSLLTKSFEEIEQRAMDPSGISGIPTGFVDIDHMLSGLNPGELIILAGRPSMGKTALALNVATNVAKKTNKTSLVFSLEMSSKQLVNRVLCSEGNIDQQAIRTGRMSEKDWEKLSKVTSLLEDIPLLFIEDSLTLSQIRADARRLHREQEIGVIVIDYLQLVGIEKDLDSYQRVSQVSRSLKLLARELNVPVIALSQLSRAVEQRQDKRPVLSDLRESGSIEQDADVVAFLYRDDYYNEESEKPNIAELIIGKQRNGPIGKVELLFLKNYSKFLSLAKAQA